ncbi:extracellular solute-binding protein [Candidatus Sumerlaeota bacterium]|nr:extracellular solute-binding protein [Candidatus Sumerlaeota bacterium]
MRTKSLRYSLLFLFIFQFLLLLPASIQGKSEKIKIKFWNALTFGQPKVAIQTLTDEFNQSQEEIFVEKLDVAGWLMNQKVLTATAGRVPPDVVLFDRFMVATFAERRAFEPFDPYLKEFGIKSEDFFPTCWNEGIYQGHVYCLPFNTDVRVLFYNKALFRKAGLDPDRPPRTWRELREYSRKLTIRTKDGHLKQVGFVPIWGNTWFYLYGWQKGGEFMTPDGKKVTVNTPPMVEAMRWIVEFCDEYGINNLEMFRSGFGGATELHPFLQGKMAMVGEEGFLLSLIKRYKPDLDFGVAPLPFPEDGRHATWSGGFGFVLPVGSKHPRAVMKFCRWMLSVDVQEKFGKISEQIPANMKAAQSPYFMNDPHWRVFVEEMKYSRYRPVTAVGEMLWNELARAVDQCVYHKKTPEQALEYVNRKVQAALDNLTLRKSLPLVNWGLIFALMGGGILVFFIWRVLRARRILRKSPLLKNEARDGYLFALPVIIGLLVFSVGPIIMAIIYSFCDFPVLTPARWVGLKNYQTLLFGDPLFWKSLWNTIFYTIFSVPLGIVIALILALLLNARIRGQSYFRTIFYIPSIVPVVAASLIWLWLFNGEFGLLNYLLELGWKGVVFIVSLAGKESALARYFQEMGTPKVPWLTNQYWAKPSLVLMSLWGVGAGMIILLAGLQGIPRHLYEAATIDGASAWQRFLHITLPMLSPTLFFLVIINTIAGFQIFTQAYIMTDGGPVDSTLFYVFYLFRKGFLFFEMGYASAMAWVLFLIVLWITLLQFKYSRKWVYYEGE